MREQVSRPYRRLSCPCRCLAIVVRSNSCESFRPKNGQAIILIGKGVYHETINITRSAPLTLLVSHYINSMNNCRLCHTGGQGQLNGTSTLPTTNIYSRNLVQVWDNRFVRDGLSNAQTAVIVIQPSTGTKESLLHALV